MKLLNIILLYLFTMSVALAHGPDGDHAHEDTPAVQVQSGAQPHFETATESFELVGRLYKDKLSMLIDRFETNAPVLEGKLEVEADGLKAQARLDAAHGDFTVDDKGMLAALAKPGKHALVFTLTTADESDLLEATLTTSADVHTDSQPRFPWAWSAAGSLGALLVLALAIKLRRSTSSRGK